MSARTYKIQAKESLDFGHSYRDGNESTLYWPLKTHKINVYFCIQTLYDLTNKYSKKYSL